MMKKLLALLLAGLLLTLTACGEKSPEQEPADIHAGERTELYDYAPPSHPVPEMPAQTETDDQFRAAWKAVGAKALEPGGTCAGLALPQMPKGRLRAELKAAGLEPEDSSAVDIRVKTEHYLLEGHHSLNQPEEQVYELAVQFFPRDGKLDAAALEQINGLLSLGHSVRLLGQPHDRIRETLGITEAMVGWLMEQKDHRYSWYEGETTYWYISWEQGNDQVLGDHVTLYVSRTELGHEQSIRLGSSDGIVSNAAYYESFQSEKGRDNLAGSARKWHAVQDMPGVWRGVRTQSGDTVTQLPADLVYMGFREDGTGLINIPGTTQGDAELTWRAVRTEQDQVLFNIIIQNKTSLDLHYHTGQHTLALTDTAGTEIIFEKAE